MPPQRGLRQMMGVPNVALSLPTVKGFYAQGVKVADQDFTITGITKDSTGAAKSGATVYLWEMQTDINGVKTPILVETTVSDGSGRYTFNVSGVLTYWITDYKTGSPDLAGATLQTLVGV